MCLGMTVCLAVYMLCKKVISESYVFRKMMRDVLLFFSFVTEIKNIEKKNLPWESVSWI